MKYFYLQMLKDKKIFHKTDGKKKHSFPLQEGATEQTQVDSTSFQSHTNATLAAIATSEKQLK